MGLSLYLFFLNAIVVLMRFLVFFLYLLNLT